MAYTVKHVAAMSGVSVRTLHFYDQADLLKPAYVGDNGYRFYEEPQLLMLQQILFYRELGFELKQIKQVLARSDFEKAAALESHRTALEANVARTRALIETIGRTLQHLKGTTAMDTKELFTGFSVAAGQDRFGEHVMLGDEPSDCKVSATDTGGTLAVFEFTGSGGGPPHLHQDQDEWIYILEGNYYFEVGERRLRLGAGESIFIPRNTSHVFCCMDGKPGKIINVYQPAGTIEAFFRDVSTAAVAGELPTRDDVANQSYTEQHVIKLRELFGAHGMKLLGPPPTTFDV